MGWKGLISNNPLWTPVRVCLLLKRLFHRGLDFILVTHEFKSLSCRVLVVAIWIVSLRNQAWYTLTDCVSPSGVPCKSLVWKWKGTILIYQIMDLCLHRISYSDLIPSCADFVYDSIEQYSCSWRCRWVFSLY